MVAKRFALIDTPGDLMAINHRPREKRKSGDAPRVQRSRFSDLEYLTNCACPVFCQIQRTWTCRRASGFPRSPLREPVFRVAATCRRASCWRSSFLEVADEPNYQVQTPRALARRGGRVLVESGSPFVAAPAAIPSVHKSFLM